MGSFRGNLLETKVKRILAIIKKVKIENKKRELWLKEGDKNVNFILFFTKWPMLEEEEIFWPS